MLFLNQAASSHQATQPLHLALTLYLLDQQEVNTLSFYDCKIVYLATTDLQTLIQQILDATVFPVCSSSEIESLNAVSSQIEV